MSTTNVKTFFEAVNSDKGLAEKLAAADKAFGEKHMGEEKNEAYRLAATQEIIIPVAKEAGFNITVDDIVAFEKSTLRDEDEEVDDMELAQVAGGNSGWGAGYTICLKLGVGLGGNFDEGGANGCWGLGFGGVSGCVVIGGSV